MLTVPVQIETIDAGQMPFRQLNEKIRELIDRGCNDILLNNVCGHRYIASGIDKPVNITINGVPGNDLAIFASGPRITVNASCQDGTGNTMDNGQIVIHGRSGDILGHSMRGGEIYVRDNVGTRVGIHMKSYEDKQPVIVIGGRAGNFLGEYMAGGILIILGLKCTGKCPVGRFVGTGMHGGKIYIRGSVDQFQLGKEVKVFDIDENDRLMICKYLNKWCEFFGENPNAVKLEEFIKLQPYTHRPYGKLYAY